MNSSTDGFRFAVIGDPIAHSKSPRMHNAALRALGLPETYLAKHVTLEELPAFVEFARANLDGFNITVPHKKNILPFLDGVSDAAKRAESVNTVTVRKGKLYGTSTDGIGLERALKEAFGFELAGSTLVFVGCGGAAQAAAMHFAAEGVRKINIVNRTLEKAENLAEKIKFYFPKTLVCCCVPGDSEAVRAMFAESETLIQCTSLGLKIDDPMPLDPALLPEKINIYDTVYTKTKLIEYASAHSYPCSRGFGMLLHQGAESFRIWTGITPPLDVMRAALAN